MKKSKLTWSEIFELLKPKTISDKCRAVGSGLAIAAWALHKTGKATLGWRVWFLALFVGIGIPLVIWLKKRRRL